MSEEVKKENPHEILTKLFSKDGYCNGTFCLRLRGYVQMSVDETNGEFVIKFLENKPQAVVTRLFTFKVDVGGIRLGTTGGILELDSFPDIPFKYDWVM